MMLSNKLTLTGSAASLKIFRDQAAEPFSPNLGPLMGRSERDDNHVNDECQITETVSQYRDDVLDFHNFIPIPNCILLEGCIDTHADWENANWGFERSACQPIILDDGIESGELVYMFITVGSPPQLLLSKVSRQFPELLFHCEYQDIEQPDLKPYLCEYKDGELVSDKLAHQNNLIGAKDVS